MFTGVIEQTGKVISVDDHRTQRRILIQTRWNDLKAGETISVNGISLVVSSINDKHEALVLVNEENLEGSTLKKLEPESQVNLERSPLVGARLSGHFVQGCVDTKGLVLNINEYEGQKKLTLALDTKYGRYCVERGSITIEGMSLKIHSLTQTKLNEFMITCLISSQAWKNSAFSTLKIADAVNVEVDVLAKYIERLSPQLEGFALTASPFEFASEPATVAVAEELASEAGEALIAAEETDLSAASGEASAADIAKEDLNTEVSEETLGAAKEISVAESGSEKSSEPADFDPSTEPSPHHTPELMA